MNSGYTIYVIDTETTGLNPQDNDVIEISMCRLSMDKPNERDQKTWCLKALNPTTIQEDALRINGHKREDIIHFTKLGREKYLEPSDVIVDIENWIIKDDVSIIDRIVVGQNILFDIEHLKALWHKVNCEETFPFDVDKGRRLIDTQQIATAIDLCTGKRRRYANLGALVESFGVKKRKAHQAEDDVAMTTDLLVTMLTPLISVATESFKNCYNNKEREHQQIE